jgi:hypothetical protein
LLAALRDALIASEKSCLPTAKPWIPACAGMTIFSAHPKQVQQSHTSTRVASHVETQAFMRHEEALAA